MLSFRSDLFVPSSELQVHFFRILRCLSMFDFRPFHLNVFFLYLVFGVVFLLLFTLLRVMNSPSKNEYVFDFTSSRTLTWHSLFLHTKPNEKKKTNTKSSFISFRFCMERATFSYKLSDAKCSSTGRQVTYSSFLTNT